MKFMYRRLFLVAVLAFVCGGMLAGCSSLFEEDSHKEWNYREIRKIVGFLDDSLVIVRDVRRWYEVSDENGDFLDGGWGHHALYLYNYRVQEDGPRWMDSLDNGFNDDFGYFKGQMTDSVVWGSDGNLWSFWKVYDKPYKVTINEMYEDCLVAFEITSVKQWLDETFIARGDGSLNAGGDSCQYAVLDTVARTVTYKRLDENLKWVRQCDDVRAWGEDVYCLVLDEETYDAYLFVNDAVVRNMEKSEYKLGDYANVSFMGPFLKLHQTVYKYQGSEVERMTSFSSQGISFGDGKGNYITY